MTTLYKKHNPLHALLHRIPAFVGVVLAFLTGGEVFPLSIIIIVISLYYLVSGVVRRKELSTPKAIAMHIAIATGFVLLGIVALLASGPASYYIIAGAWLLHAVWDLYLFRKNVAVPRWLTEFCMVYDVLIAALLVIAAARL